MRSLLPAQSMPFQILDFGRTFVGSLFRLNVDGKGPIGYFTGVSGLSITYQVVEQATTAAREDGTLYTPKRVGTVSYTDVKLVRGMSPDDRMMLWLEEWERNTATRYTAGIDIMGPFGGPLGPPVDTFELTDVWPLSWEAGSLSADSDEKVTETLTLAHGGIKRKALSPM